MELEQDSEIKLAKNGNHEAFINLIKPLELQMYSIAKAILRTMRIVQMPCRKPY
ncbi:MULTISPECIES: hypothetical protein [Paenibacillus]|uniref:hypothetical protein n=1 Tax=Paenibacillus TaxID=44249 RepID=UPI0004AFD3A5|nr:MULTISPECIES: hypothetical protein [Paenibacillus]